MLSRPIANYWRVFPLSKYFVYIYEKKIMFTQFMKLLIQKDTFLTLIFELICDILERVFYGKKLMKHIF